MSLPTTNEGVGFVTYDDYISNPTDLLNKQLSDLSGNAIARQFCEDAFNLTTGVDISNALITDSEIDENNDDKLAFIGSSNLVEQKTYLSSKLRSSKFQEFLAYFFNYQPFF